MFVFDFIRDIHLRFSGISYEDDTGASVGNPTVREGLTAIHLVCRFRVPNIKALPYGQANDTFYKGVGLSE